MTKPPERTGDTYDKMAKELDDALIDQMKNGVPVVDRDGFPVTDPETKKYLMKPCPPTVLSVALRRLQQVGFVKPSGKKSELERLASEAARSKPGVPAPGPDESEDEDG